MADRVGQQFGNYRLLALLGQGGFAEVYLGQHIWLNLQAAIKVLHMHLAGSEAEHFYQEAQTIATLMHPSIVRVLDYAVQEGVPFLVMDYAPGGSLRLRSPKGTVIPLSQIVSIVKQVAIALQYAHEQKIIHCDVKPENMLVGRHEEVLLSDFGLAALAHGSASLNTQQAMGTLPYMAPEQIEGHPRVASDQYALGVVVYEWLCGARPFEGSATEVIVQHLNLPPPPLHEHVVTIPLRVEQVVLRALAKEPKDRFASVQDFAEALEQASQLAPANAVSLPSEQPAPGPAAAISYATVAVAPDQPVVPTREIPSAELPVGTLEPSVFPSSSLPHDLTTPQDERDLLWARLTLLLDWTEPIATGTINAGQWKGCDPQAVAIARASGDEDDYARTLEPYDWRTREETDAVLALARTWQHPAAILRALDVVARDLAFRHGAFREAAERFEELLVTSRHYGSIPGQAEALLQLSACQLVLGQVALAQHTAQRVQEMVTRLGSMHRLRVVIEVGMVTGFAYYVDGDWPALATVATQFVASPEAARSPLGLFVAANAAHNHSRAGNLTEARRILSALLAVLPALPPTMYVHNGTVNIAATAVWELGAVEWATTCRQLALDLIAAGIGGHFMGSHELTVARMAALLGDMAEASTYFALARTELEASGRRPLRAIADYDEAQALLRASSAEPARVSLLLDAALAQFRTLGMEVWMKRTLEQQEQLALRRHPTSSRERMYPDNLTAREVEVLRLLAEGKTNKEIATALVVSVPTVQRHIANIYGKIGARGRADATAYAIRRGLASPGSP